MIDKFISFLKELEQNKGIRIQENSLEEVLKLNALEGSERAKERVKRIIKTDVPTADFDMYMKLNSLTLDWDAIANDPDEEYMWGGFKINGFSSALGSPSNFWDIYNNDPRFWENNPQPEAEAIWKDFLPKLNYFQRSGHGDDGTFGCILREEGIYPCPVYFFDSGIWFKMDMSLEEYYDTMIASKAVYYWQYFYIDTQEIVKKLGNYKPVFIEAGAKYVEGPHPFSDKFKDGTFTYSTEGVLHQMKSIIKRFPKLFPDADLTYFKERCNALEKALKL